MNPNKKYYLVNYIYQPVRGVSSAPHRSKMYEFDDDKSPLECYEEIYKDLNKGGSTGNEWHDFHCAITNMTVIK